MTERDARYVTQFALKWLDKQNKSKPIFLWAHYSDPHSPYVYRSDFKFPLLRGELFMSPGYRYDTEVAHADFYIGQLLDGMRKRGLLENTLIVFMADHGESLGERGYYGHGRHLYESSIKVPMAVIGPEIKQGITGKFTAQLVDIMPTILYMLRLTPPTGVRGEYLVETDGTPRQITRSELFIETYRGAVPDVPGADKMMPGVKPLLLGMKQGKWKCIFSPEKGRAELYDLETDPHEDHNLSGSHPQLAAEMTKKVESWHQSTNPYKPAQQPIISEETQKKLKALGYIH